MKITKIILGILTPVAIIALGFVFFNPTTPKAEGGFTIPNINSAATSSSIAIGTSNLENQNPSAAKNNKVLATTSPGTQRVYAIICNAGSEHAYMSMASDSPAVALAGIRLAVGSCYELIDGENLYNGTIRAVTETASTTLTFEDYWSK